jgi:hypothetical protein
MFGVLLVVLCAQLTIRSVVLSPKSRADFDTMLRALAARRQHVCLVYGRQDPWVVPMWGQRAMYVLQQAGCPPHMVSGWLLCRIYSSHESSAGLSFTPNLGMC